ncbi:MAG: protein phosphatase [Gammaproteobacteria bacterium]|nr:protein phosphatase [Gammaproteobacteria bacterium]
MQPSLHPFDKLSLSDGGTLIFTPCPGAKGVPLDTSIAQLAQAGAGAVITVMPDEEMARNQVTAMPEVCREQGVQWFHFSIEDDRSPGEVFQQTWKAGRQKVFEILDRQGTLAIHCKGGSGRTGLMAAVILLERGMPDEQVVARVQALRPKALKLAVHTEYLEQTYP